jgi:hypothetical protein
LGIKRLIAYGDSKVVIDHVNKACDIRKDSMNAHYAEVRKLEAHFEGLEFHHVCWDNNVAPTSSPSLKDRNDELERGQ